MFSGFFSSIYFFVVYRDDDFQDKISFFATVITESMLIDRVKTEITWKNEYLEIVSSLNGHELIFLKTLYEHSRKMNPISSNAPIFNEFEFKKTCIKSLSRKGVIEDASIQKVNDVSSPGHSKLIKNDELVVITDIGYKTIQFMLSVHENLKNNSSYSTNT